MKRDFENIHDLDDLSDDEIRELVLSRLAEHPAIDHRDLEIGVEDGVVRLQGRVGTEQERRIALRVVTDEIGIEQTEDEILVDPVRRPTSSEDLDEHVNELDREQGLMLGDRPLPTDPESEHLYERSTREGSGQGTTDVGKSIAGAEPWVPPRRPTPEGVAGPDAEPPDMAEEH